MLFTIIIVIFNVYQIFSCFGQSKDIITDMVPKTDYLMCSGITSATDTDGTLYDSGGSDGNYTNNENCSFLINPGCAYSITLNFINFHLESCCDFFKVYDGPDISGTLLLSANGSTIPDPVTATTGVMFITFTSDGSVTYPGWQAVWTSVLPTSPPIADFSISDINPPFNTEVQFTDLTTNLPGAWVWSFGDGQTSTLQNPTHNYLQSGLHTVTLIADNCYSTDTVSHDLIVQESPEITIEPDIINEIVSVCGDSVTLPLTIYNSGNGPLIFDIESGNGDKNTIELLALTYGVDYDEEYLNTINALNQYFTDYNLTEINTTIPTELEVALSGKDVLLVPEQEYGLSNVFTGFSPVLLDYVINGGSVVFCGTTNYSCITNSGLLYITSINDVYNSILNVIDTGHPLTSGLPDEFIGQNGTYAAYYSEPLITNLVENSYNNQNVLSLKEIGNGTVIYLANDFYNYDDNAAKMISNSIQYAADSPQTLEWFSFSPDSGLVVAGDSAIIIVKSSKLSPLL